MNRVTSKDGTPIAFDKIGQGPAIILVDGALGERSDARPLAELLAPHLTVFAYDRRGRGDSGDTPPYAVMREIEDIDALIQAAGGSAALFGGSSGAVLALNAVAHGLAVTRLAMYEPPFIVGDGHPPLPKDYIETLNSLVSSGRRGDAVEYFMRSAVGVPDEIIAQMRGAPMWAGMEKIAHTIPYDGMVMGDTMAGKPLPAERWASVTIPTLVLVGGASPAWAHSAGRAITGALANARYVTLEGQTHAVDPAVVAPVLLNFITG